MAFDPISGAIVGGALSSAIGGLFGRSSARRSMAFQKEVAQKGHQWEVADLRAAGLNPILSGTGGPGARASGGAMPPPLADVATSAMGVRRLAQELKNMEAVETRTNAEAKLADAKTQSLGGVAVVGNTVGDFLSFMKEQAVSTAKDVTRAVARYWSHFDGTSEQRSDIQKAIDQQKRTRGPIKSIKFGE